MVWIHGGGFQFGSSASPSINGRQLARKGVVVVTFNYRLGVFGLTALVPIIVRPKGRASGIFCMGVGIIHRDSCCRTRLTEHPSPPRD